MPWSEERKAAIELAVGSTSYTSSDESDFSEDENGERVLSGYLVKKLPWERTTLTKAKKVLDDAYKKSLNPRARVNLVTRRVHPRPSTRCPPTNVLEWAVRVQEPTPSSGTRPAAAMTPSSSARLETISTHTPSPRIASPSPHTILPTSTATAHSMRSPTMATPSRSTHISTTVAPSTHDCSSRMTTPSHRTSPSTTETPSTRTCTHPPSTSACPSTMMTPPSSTHVPPTTARFPDNGKLILQCTSFSNPFPYARLQFNSKNFEKEENLKIKEGQCP